MTKISSIRAVRFANSATQEGVMQERRRGSPEERIVGEGRRRSASSARVAGGAHRRRGSPEERIVGEGRRSPDERIVGDGRRTSAMGRSGPFDTGKNRGILLLL
jgi:hypothetical protein